MNSNNITFGRTALGTLICLISYQYVKKYILLTRKQQIIHISNTYYINEEIDCEVIQGSQLDKYLHEKDFAMKIDALADHKKLNGYGTYAVRIYKLLEKPTLTSIDYIILQSNALRLKNENERLKESIYNFEVYGTDNEGEILKIKSKREKEKQAEIKRVEKLFKSYFVGKGKKEKVLYIKVKRNYSGGKGGYYNFQGLQYTIESSKPTTRTYYTLILDNCRELAEKLHTNF